MRAHRARQVRARAAGVGVGLVVALLLVAGCGIPEDGSPREIPDAALPAELVDPGGTAPDIADGEGRIAVVELYLVSTEGGTETLVPVARSVRLPTDPALVPGAVTQLLIAANPDKLGRAELVNAVPSDTQVRSATVGAGGVLDLDLTNLNVQSSLQRLAVAQLVFTLTALDDPRVDAVRFSVDGTPVAVPVEGSVAPAGTAVGRNDEPSFLNPTTTTAPPDGG